MTDMIERRLPLLLGLLLAISLAGNAVQWRAAHPDQPAPLRGTYTLGASTAAERLTFPTEGGWYRYQNGALLGRGTIHAQEDGVYFLQAETGADAYLFRRGGTLYQDRDGGLLAFRLQTKDSIFVNFDPNET